MSSTSGNHKRGATLGLRNDATEEEVKLAYRDLEKIWHPDRFNEDDIRLRKKAEEKLKEINVAYSGIQEAQPQYPQQTDSAIKRQSLRETVLEAQAFVTTNTIKVSTLQIKMSPGFKSKEILGAAIQECFVLCKEGVSRLKAVICRIGQEAPEYPRTGLECSPAKPAEYQAELEEYAASTASFSNANVWKP